MLPVHGTCSHDFPVKFEAKDSSEKEEKRSNKS